MNLPAILAIPQSGSGILGHCPSGAWCLRDDIAGVPIAEDAAFIEAALDVDITPRATLGNAYQGQFGDGAMQNGAKANLSVRFQ